MPSTCLPHPPTCPQLAQVSSLSESVKELGGQLHEEMAVGAALRRQLAEWSSTLGAQRTLLEAPEYNGDLAAAMVLVAGLLEGQVRVWAAGRVALGQSGAGAGPGLLLPVLPHAAQQCWLADGPSLVCSPSSTL